MVLTEFIMLTHLVPAFLLINGCGVLPYRQGRRINFEVSGFKLPAEMAYSVDVSAPSTVSTISTSEQQAVTFVQNTVIRSIEDTLFQQGRTAGLSDDVISLILNQLDVTVKYEPLKCDILFTGDGNGVVMPMKTNCQVMGGTVTKTCSNPAMMAQGGNMVYMCMPPMLEGIQAMHLTISGSITTTNIIMANWSTQMWQIILNRALRSFTSGPLGSQFISASITLKKIIIVLECISPQMFIIKLLFRQKKNHSDQQQYIQTFPHEQINTNCLMIQNLTLASLIEEIKGGSVKV